MTELFSRVESDCVREGLHKMLALIEKGWCQGVPALDEHKRVVFPINPDACAWCLGGAAVAVADESGSYSGDLLTAIWQSLPPTKRPKIWQNMTFWNDDRRRTKAEVIEAIRTAILPGLQNNA